MSKHWGLVAGCRSDCRSCVDAKGRSTRLCGSILFLEWATSRSSMGIGCQVKGIPQMAEGIDGVEHHRAKLVCHDQGEHSHKVRNLNLNTHAAVVKG